MADPMTYAKAGVDIHREDEAVAALAKAVTFTRQGVGAPLGSIGHFAGLVDFGDHALCLCTDGVGSKLEIARATGVWDTVGIDCMAMNVNDAICVGAEPIAFVDYLAVEDPDPDVTAAIGRGLQRGAEMANVSLIGGETATLPGIIQGYDLAGTCLAYARKDRLVTGQRIAPGDVVIGLASTGIHSNGYTLARRVFEDSGHTYDAAWPWPEDGYDKTVGEVLLEPTRIYVREIMALLSAVPVHGLAHITGSGLRKLRRGNASVRYEIDEPLPVPPVFRRIQQLGGVTDHEMYRTFNMGMGFAVIVPAEAEQEALSVLRSHVDYDVRRVGRITRGTGVSHPVGLEH